MRRKMLQQSDCLSDATGNLSLPLHDWVNSHKENVDYENQNIVICNYLCYSVHVFLFLHFYKLQAERMIASSRKLLFVVNACTCTITSLDVSDSLSDPP